MMPLKKTKQSTELQIEPEAREFNHTFLLIQRLGYALMAALILAALLGLFGSGILNRTVKINGNLTVIYDKYLRTQAISKISIQIRDTCDKEINVALSKSILEKAVVKNIHPIPSKSINTNNNVLYSFHCASLSDRMQIMLLIEPDKLGMIKGTIQTSTNTIAINQTIYP